MNGSGHEQSEFDPLRKTLSREVDRLARMQAGAPVERLTYEQIREEQKALKKVGDDVQPYAGGQGNDSWRRVASRVVDPRREQLSDAALAPKHRTGRIAEQERIDRERAAAKAEDERRYAEYQAKLAAEAPEREARQKERYAEVTLPLVERARLDPKFAQRITRWGINLERSDHDAARDPIWTMQGKGHDGKLIWSIVTSEADSLDREAEQRRQAHEAEQEKRRKAWEERQAVNEPAPKQPETKPEPQAQPRNSGLSSSFKP